MTTLPLVKKEVSFTGRLASMTRGEAVELVESLGGAFAPVPTRRTAYVVVGQEGFPLKNDGSLSNKLKRARRLAAQGFPVQVVAEETFLELIGASDRGERIHRRYTIPQLVAITGVRKNQIRLWRRTGLLEPVCTLCRLEFFDFEQVARARHLAELVAGGVPVVRIQETLRQVQATFPNVGELVNRLSAENDRLLFRLDGGELVDAAGQLHFDLDGQGDDDTAATVQFAPAAKSFDELMEDAFEAEQRGRLKAAADAYQQALLVNGGSAECCFNLGNVLYQLDQKEAAAERYWQALEHDRDYVEAWNNLGNILADLERFDDAAKAFREAIKRVPTYADAHYNLAATLSAIGKEHESAPHWREFLRLDPDSPSAREIRRRLGVGHMA